MLWVEAAGIHMSGEKFRSLFSLQSACFTISENGGNVTLESKGVGHGLGFCQFEANRRAVQGEDFLALLHVFLKAWKFKKLNKGRENGKTKLEGFQLIIGICQNE